MASYLQDARFFDAKFILPASTNRTFLSCPARRRVISVDTTFNGVVTESTRLSADTGAIAVAPYNTTSDLGTVWVSTIDGNLWSMPVTSSIIGAPTKQMTFARSNWLAVLTTSSTWIVCPMRNGGVAVLDTAGGSPTKFYEGAVTSAAFGLGAGKYLYLFDGRGAGALFEMDDRLGLVKRSDFTIPGAVDIIDGVLFASGPGSLALPTGFVLASQARDATMVYSTAALETPTLVSRTPYDEQGFTLNGVFNDGPSTPVTSQEYPGLGFPTWFPASAGRDDQTGSVLTTSAGNGRLQAIVQGGSMVDISNSTVTAAGTLIARTMAARTAEVYNVKDFGAIGDGVSHVLNSSQASVYNAQYGTYGIAAVAGDENDYIAILAAMYRAANTGVPVYIPTGVYLTNKPLTLQWTGSPPTGQPNIPSVTKIYGDGYSSQIKGTIATAGRAVMELIGYDNGYAVNCELSHLRISMSGGSNGAFCLRAGDAWTGFKAYRVSCEGANCLALRVASSVTYANLNTSFDQCRFMANYGYLWWADDTTAQAYSLCIETGGAYWDNVRFASCIFGNGLADVRAFVGEFDNCQFYINPARAAPFNQNLNCSIGCLHVANCYFEDHDTAIVCVPYVADIRGVTIINSQFTGLTNFPSGSCKRAIVCSAGPNGNIGPVVIEGNKIGSTTYVNECIQLIGVCGRVGFNTNIANIGVALRTDYQFSNIINSEYITAAGNLVCENRSTFVKDTFQVVVAESSAQNSIRTPGGLTADTNVTSPQHHADRASSGSGNAGLWGFSTQRADGLDYFIHGWSSTAYTTGGPLPWVPNNTPITYIPTGYTWTIGFGTQLPVAKFAPTMIYSPGGFTASSTDYTSVGNVPQVLKYTLTRTSFSAAALTSSITLFQLQPKQFLIGVTMKHSASFTGGAIASYTIQVGNNSVANKYAPAFNVFQAPGNQVFQWSQTGGMEDFAAAQNVQITATSTGANLSAATAGSVDLYFIIGTLP